MLGTHISENRHRVMKSISEAGWCESSSSADIARV